MKHVWKDTQGQAFSLPARCKVWSAGNSDYQAWRRCSKKLSVLVVATLAGSAGASYGAAIQVLEQNASGLGNAYSGQAAAAENASVIYYNPAAMTQLPGTRFSASAVVIRPSLKFSDSGASVAPDGAAAPTGGSNGGDAGGWNYVPSVYYSKQLSPKLWAGVGLSVPFGLKTQYDPEFIGRYQSQKTDIKSYDINPSVAYKISDAISIGAGLSYQHFRFKLERSAFVGAEAASSMDLSDSQWGWNAGALFTPAPGTRIGLSYRSSMGYHLSGTVQVAGVPGFPTTGTASVRLPATSSLALTQKISDKVQVLSDFTYTHWSSIKAVPLVLASGVVADTFNFQFRDSWRIGAGVNYKWSQDTTLKLGVAYEISPVTNQYRTTALPDNDRIWIGIGGKWALSKVSTLDIGYAHVFVPRSGTINQPLGVGVLFGQGSVIGNYNNRVDILSAQYSYAF
jgi:long-chain fatty acid transport protein